MVWFLAVVILVGAFWMGRVFSRDSRAVRRYLYNRATNPAALNGAVRGDALGEYAGDGAGGGNWPWVTIIVPGRNEGHVLRATLGSLCAMDYPNCRVVFVDDQSTDDTAAVCAELAAKYKHLEVIHNTEAPPAGWVGKVWAVHQARERLKEAQGDAGRGADEYVLFVDSDLRFDAACLKQAVRLARHRGVDLLSFLPFCECGTLGEKLGMMMVLQLIAMKYPLRKANDPRTTVSLVAGGFMLFRRTAYEAIGGHEAVRGHVIEDVALGQLTKSKGHRVFATATEDLVVGHMYEGWRDTFRGLRKNAYAGAHFNPIVGAGGAVALTVVGVLMPVYPVVGIWLWVTQPGLLTLTICAASIAAFWAMLRAMGRAGGFLRFPTWMAWLGPAAAGFFVVVLVASMVDYYRGGAQWSGRTYKPGEMETLKTAAQKE